MARKKRNRANGQGTLEKRGTYWLARWTVDGKHFSKSTHCTDRTEAEKKLAEFIRPFQIKDELEKLETIKAKIATKENELNAIELEERKVRIEDAYDEFAKRGFCQDLSEATTRNYKGMWNGFASSVLEDEECKKRKVEWLDDLNEGDIERYLEKMRNELSPCSFNVKLTMVKKVFKVLGVKEKTKHLLDTFTRRSKDKSSRRELTEEEIRKVLAEIAKYKDEDMREQMMLLVVLAVYTAMRKGDLSYLKWSEVDFSRNMIVKVPHKTKRLGNAVVVPMHKCLSLVFSKYRKRDDEYVMPLIRKMYDSGKIDYEIRKLFQRCGIVTSVKSKNGKWKVIATFHSFRHSAISFMFNAGMSYDVIQKIVGHTSSTMTEHYSHINIAAAQKAISALPEVGQEKKSEVIDVVSYEDCGELTKDDVNLIKSMFDSKCDKTISDTVKKMVETYKLLC